MAAPFAARQQRLNAAVLKHLSDAEGLLDGQPVSGIFSDDYTLPTGAISASGPALVLADVQAAAAVEGSSALVLGATTWRVRTKQPDGAGLTALLLTRAA